MISKVFLRNHQQEGFPRKLSIRTCQSISTKSSIFTVEGFLGKLSTQVSKVFLRKHREEGFYENCPGHLKYFYEIIHFHSGRFFTKTIHVGIQSISTKTSGGRISMKTVHLGKLKYFYEIIKNGWKRRKGGMLRLRSARVSQG